MSIPKSEFFDLYRAAHSDLVGRVMGVLEKATEALSALDVAAELVGGMPALDVTAEPLGGLGALVFTAGPHGVSASAVEAMPLVLQVLQALVRRGRLVSVEVDQVLLGPCAYFALPSTGEPGGSRSDAPPGKVA